ncbi:hypothetical protein AKO1_014831 [Acrasis kona]|uniref:F-box domain-containing protein n=1 Tax=Acrasis kona TaxID=1008807 RepID=A0AAW2Z2I1_9EUKA
MIVSIPKDVMIEILHYLDLKDVFKLCSLNSTLKKLLYSIEEEFWGPLYFSTLRKELYIYTDSFTRPENISCYRKQILRRVAPLLTQKAELVRKIDSIIEATPQHEKHLLTPDFKETILKSTNLVLAFKEGEESFCSSRFAATTFDVPQYDADWNDFNADGIIAQFNLSTFNETYCSHLYGLPDKGMLYLKCQRTGETGYNWHKASCHYHINCCDVLRTVHIDPEKGQYPLCGSFIFIGQVEEIIDVPHPIDLFPKLHYRSFLYSSLKSLNFFINKDTRKYSNIQMFGTRHYVQHEEYPARNLLFQYWFSGGSFVSLLYWNGYPLQSDDCTDVDLVYRDDG